MKSPRRFTSRAARSALFAMGWILLGLGVVGLVLPLMPGTVFLIGAAACFARSSPRFERWLLTHPKLGPTIADWRSHSVIPLRAKIIAVSAMIVSLVFATLSAASDMAKIISAITIAAAALYIRTRPSARP